MRKVFPRLLTTIIFLLSAFLIIHPFSWSFPITGSLSLFLNLIIIWAATYFSALGMLTFGLLSILVVLWQSLLMAKFLGYPIILLIGTMGICYVYYFRERDLNQKIDRELNDIIEEKNVLAAELEHLRLENTSFKQKLRRYANLKGLTETLSSTLSFDEAVSLIVDEALRILGKSNACLLYLMDKEKQELSLLRTKVAQSPGGSLEPEHKTEAERVVSEAAWVKLKNGDLFDNWIVRQRAPLAVKDTKKDFRFNVRHDIDQIRSVRSLIAVPLIRENKLLGILRLDNVAVEAYETDDLRLLDIISGLAAVAIENILLYQETRKLAITDGLTGLFVHRYFQERFDEEISRAIWTNSQFAFVMIDIDYFKGYNDRYGHIAGDIVLRKVAQLICANTNPGDIVARYGGEEFAVLLVETPRLEALKVAERIRLSIEKEKFVLRRQTTELRISAGLSFFPDEGQTKEGLIKRADQALYKAKHEGRNRICTS